jgi:hypothetical protein
MLPLDLCCACNDGMTGAGQIRVWRHGATYRQGMGVWLVTAMRKWF